MPDDLVLEAPPDDEATPPAAPPVTAGSVDAPDEPEETPAEDEAPPPVEKPKRSLVQDLQQERVARREAAERAQRLEQEAAQMRPIMQALARHPNGVQILQSLVQGQPVAPAAPAAPDPEVLQIAEDFGLYNVDGTPDLVKAGRIAQRQARVAQQAAAAAVGPVQQGAEAQQANVARTQLWQQAHQPGNTQVNPEALGQILQALPDNLLVHKEVQNLVWVLAAGATALQQGTAAPAATPPAPSAPPVFTEAAGGRARTSAPLAAPFQTILKRAGMNEKDISTSLGRFVPGAPVLLE